MLNRFGLTDDLKPESDNPFLGFLSSSVAIFFNCQQTPPQARIVRVTEVERNRDDDLLLSFSRGICGQMVLQAETNLIRWHRWDPDAYRSVIQFFDAHSAQAAARFYRWFGSKLLSPNDGGTLRLLVPPGFSMFAHHLRVTEWPIRSLLPYAPDGATLYRFDSDFRIFRSNTFRAGKWDDPHDSIRPSEGTFVLNPSDEPMVMRFGNALRPKVLPRERTLAEPWRDRETEVEGEDELHATVAFADALWPGRAEVGLEFKL